MTSFSIIFGILTVVLLVLVAGLVRVVGDKYALSAETQRKLVHVSVGIFALILPLFLDRKSFTVFALFALAALLLLRVAPIRKTYGAAVHSVERSSWGDILFLVSVSVLFFLAAGDPILYVLPLAVVTISDACAAVIGTEYGRRKFGTKDRTKSIEGTTVFFIVTWIVCVIIMILTPSIERENIIPLATIIAAFSALVEASSWRGLDNLFVPLGIFALLAFNPTNLIMQLLLAALFIVIMVASSIGASFLNLSAHACRSTVICLFLTVGLTSIFYAIFPLAALIANISLRNKTHPSDDTDLQLIVVMTLVGVFWLVAGRVTGYIAIEFYTITFAALLAGLLMLHFTDSSKRVRWLAAITISGLVFILENILIVFGNTNISWLNRPSAWAISALAILSCVGITFFNRVTQRHIIYKITLVATLICTIGLLLAIQNSQKPVTFAQYFIQKI